MTDTVRLTIDGTDVTVPAGTRLVEAARRVGIDIPVFCHHPRLEPVGMCRMCLVEVGTPVVDRDTGEVERDEAGAPVIRFYPQLTTACTTPASEGMVVRTATEAVAEARRGVLEFLLTSHPLDCPVCDKGGECPLQNLTMRYGPGESRFVWAEKQRFPKPVPLGPLIALDRERCILCARCIRFQDEIADDPVLAFESRGRGMEITTLSDPPFDSYYSGNTTDICPVGALTTRDFRFQARAWEVVGSPSVCAHCPVGCNTMLDARHGEVIRVMPRENDDVNEIWLCDKGRFAHHFASSPERLAHPMVRRDGTLVPVSWAEALDAAADGLRAVRDESGPDSIGGIAGGTMPNEDLYMFGRFLRAVVGTNHVDHFPSIVRDDAPARAGVGGELRLPAVSGDTAIVVVGLDVEEEAPLLYLAIRAAQRRGAHVTVLGGRPQKLERHADVSLRYRYGGEDEVVAVLARRLLDGAGLDSPAGGGAGDESPLWSAVEPFTPDVLAGVHPIRVDDLEAAAAAVAGSADVLVLYGRDAGAAGLAPALEALVIAAGKRGREMSGLVPVGPQANSQGAADMGLLPEWLPGFRAVDDEDARANLAAIWPAEPPRAPGFGARAMLAGDRLRGLLLLDSDAVAAEGFASEMPRFVIAFDAFLTPVSARAHVVFPVQTVPECDGTMTSMTRRVQRFAAAAKPFEASRPAWRVLRDLGHRFGVAEPFDAAADVAAEIAAAVPGYEGMTHDALGAGDVRTTAAVLLPFAPDTEARHVTYHGTAYTNPFGRGRTWSPATAGTVPPAAPTWRPRDRAVHDRLLLVPTTSLYDARPTLWSSAILRPLVPGAHIVMSPFDAGPRGLVDGARARVRAEDGTSMSVTVRVRDGMTPGVVLAPTRLGGHVEPARLVGDKAWVGVAVEAEDAT